MDQARTIKVEVMRKHVDRFGVGFSQSTPLSNSSCGLENDIWATYPEIIWLAAVDDGACRSQHFKNVSEHSLPGVTHVLQLLWQGACTPKLD